MKYPKELSKTNISKGRKSMKKFVAVVLVFSLAIIAFVPFSTFAQLATPQVHNLFKGRIDWIKSIAPGTTQSRVIISTERANSDFYADMDHSLSPVSFGSFQVVPGLDDSAGSGVINRFFGVAFLSGIFFVGSLLLRKKLKVVFMNLIHLMCVR